MSYFFPAPEAIITELGPAQAILYGRIWRYCQGGGTCFASLASLAAECNVNERTVRRWITELAAAGYITHESGKATGKTNSIATTPKWVMGGVGQDVQRVGQDVQGGRTISPTGVGQNVQRLKDFDLKTEEKALTPNPHGPDAPSTTPSTAPTTARPTVQAGNPADQVAQRTVPTRAPGNATPSRAQRSTKTDRAATPTDNSDAPGGRWHPVAAAIMAALGRPAPRGKLPSWLGNTVAAFGAAAGDDPDRAALLVEAWAKSKAFRDNLSGGYLRDHSVPAIAGSWIATSGRAMSASRQSATQDREASRMQRLGAPDNWRELVYTHDGTKRSPVLALPRIGLEPYAQQGTWPAWYRAFEGVGS